MRATVFLGAGAAIEIGGPITSEITNAARKKVQTFLNRKKKFIDQVAKVLDKHYAEPVSFEEIFHTLELISSYRIGWKGATKKCTPYMTAFTKPRLLRFFKDDIMLLIAKKDLIRTVAELIYKYDSRYLHNNANNWHLSFWEEINNSFKLDIATLNYDTCIEQSILDLEDGFEKTIYQFERFNPKQLINSKKSKIFHLHGCINYGYSRGEKSNEYTLEDDFHDIYKYQNYKEASQTWFGRSTNISQSSEEANVGPIVTGLQKTDKIINFPYSLYYSELQSAIIANNALLIIGYSFGDLHFNRLLERIVRIHGKQRRVVVITKYTKQFWHRDWTVMGWSEKRDMMVFASKAFQDYYPFKSNSFSKPPEVLNSKDNCARIYLGGFKETVNKYSKEIINFLKS